MITNSVKNLEHKSLFIKMISSCFGTKKVSIFTIFLITIILSRLGTFVFPVIVVSTFNIWLPLVILPLIFWVLLLVVLYIMGYKKEADYILEGIGIIALTIPALIIIGFILYFLFN